MKSLFIVLLFTAILAADLVSKEYTEYLRKTVSWEVADYEDNIFKGWTIEDAQDFLGLLPSEPISTLPEHLPEANLPRAFSWEGVDCIHPVRNQGNCGSCWAFAASGMLSDRCCLGGSDQGPLSPQELVSCETSSMGCNGGYMETPISYIVRVGGLVKEECYPYQAKNAPCPRQCVDGKDWKGSHVCKCHNPQGCSSTNSMKSCLKSGPVTYSFHVCQSFFSYRSGVYKCDCSSYIGGHAVLAVGYSDDPECHFITKNSWSDVWGDHGYFKMACNTCGLNGGMMCATVN